MNTDEPFDTVIYHASCWDGFCAAFLLWREEPESKFIPAHYGQDPPDVKDKRVAIVDFSYKREVMKKLAEDAKMIVVLDHHKTAKAELEGLEKDHYNLDITFDMEKSGGRLTWEYLNGTKSTHWLVDYTEDRDLWLHKMPQTKEINAALRSYPLDFEVWENFYGNRGLLGMGEEGAAILRAETQIIGQHVGFAREFRWFWQGVYYDVLGVNATCMMSEIAGSLAKNRAFGFTWFQRQDGMFQYSLRNRHEGNPNALDVSEIAKYYGGGGHEAAAGFSQVELVPLGDAK